MRGQKTLSPSEQIARYVEGMREVARLEMINTTIEGREITSAAWGAWNAYSDILSYIRSVLRSR